MSACPGSFGPGHSSLARPPPRLFAIRAQRGDADDGGRAPLTTPRRMRAVLELAAARRLTERHLQHGQKIVDGVAAHRSHWCRIEANPVAHFFVVRLLSYLPILCIRVHTCLHVVGHERADKPEPWREARAKPATTGEPGEDDDQRRHTPGRGGGSRRPCVTTWPPSAPRAASTDR